MRWRTNPSRGRAFRVVVIATTAVAGVAAVAGVLVGSGQAGSSGRSAPRAVAHHPVAVQVKCGDVITTDARLTRDLNNCPADGVIIGAPRVTLDLDGYTIDGVGAGIGVNNSGGYDDVTVKDGTVHQFMDGIRLTSADENRLSRLTVSVNAGQGIALEMSNDNRIERVSAADNAGETSGPVLSSQVGWRAIPHETIGG
jgi:parallel beta-helix repeat protein